MKLSAVNVSSKDKMNSFIQNLPIDPIFFGAFVLALLAHGLLLLVHFGMPEMIEASMQDVTLAVQLEQDDKPEQADFLAEHHQAGGGTLDKPQRMTNSDRSEFKMDIMDYVNPNESSQAVQKAVENNAEYHFIFATLSWRKDDKSSIKKRRQAEKLAREKRQSTAAMIATLEAEYADRKQQLAKKSKIQTVDSVSALSDKNAHYLESFRKTVERVGNRHYPSEAKQNRLSGDVRVMVILMSDGTIKAIRVLKTSGSRILDEGAKQSIRDGAPYPHFDARMKRDVEELRIIRTIRYTSANTAPQMLTDVELRDLKK